MAEWREKTFFGVLSGMSRQKLDEEVTDVCRKVVQGEPEPGAWMWPSRQMKSVGEHCE